jgi:hypothetical protein
MMNSKNSRTYKSDCPVSNKATKDFDSNITVTRKLHSNFNTLFHDFKHRLVLEKEERDAVAESPVFDCEQERRFLWNSGSRFSYPYLAKIYMRTKQVVSNHISVQNNVFRRCLRGNHAACNGLVSTDDYMTYCQCPCHSLTGPQRI